MTIIEKDIFKAFDENEINIIVHQCNCFCTMGTGIAKEIKERFPEAYEADKETARGDIHKLGTFSAAKIGEKRIVNLYAQYNYGRDQRYTNYEAFANGLEALRDSIKTPEKWKIGFPYKIGCNSAGGNWNIIEKIIDETFSGSKIEVRVYKV